MSARDTDRIIARVIKTGRQVGKWRTFTQYIMPNGVGYMVSGFGLLGPYSPDIAADWEHVPETLPTEPHESEPVKTTEGEA